MDCISKAFWHPSFMELPCHYFRVDPVMHWTDAAAHFSLVDVRDGFRLQHLPWWVTRITACCQFLQGFIDLGDFKLDRRFYGVLEDVCMVHGEDI